MKKKTACIFFVLTFICSLMFYAFPASSAMAATYLLGDVNGDGVLNSKDVLLLRKYNAQYNVKIVKNSADCNADGYINNKDILLLRRHLAKMITLGSIEIAEPEAKVYDSILGDQPSVLFSDITEPLKISPVSIGNPYEYYYNKTDDGSENYQWNMFARNPWDMINFDDKIFVASGDFNKNTGPVPIKYYDTKTTQWIKTGSLTTESVTMFTKRDNRLFTFPSDSTDDIRFYEYALSGDRWLSHKGINQQILHAYSMEYFDNCTFIATPSNNGGPKLSISQDMKTLIEPVFYDKDDTQININSIGGLYIINDELYTIANFAVYKYDKTDKAFHYFGKSIPFSQIPVQKALSGKFSYSMSNYEKYETIGNVLAIAVRNGGLVKTENLNDYSLVIPEPDFQVTDLVKIDGKLYLYASKQIGDDLNTATFINAMYETSDLESFKKIFEYESNQHSQSCEYSNGAFYLGNAVDLGYAKQNAGEIYRVQIYNAK